MHPLIHPIPKLTATLLTINKHQIRSSWRQKLQLIVRIGPQTIVWPYYHVYVYVVKASFPISPARAHLRNGEVCGVLYVAGLLVNQREGRVHALILGSVFALLIQGRFLRGRASLRLTVHWRRKHLLKKVQTTIHSVNDLGEQTSGTIAITKLTSVVKRFRQPHQS